MRAAHNFRDLTGLRFGNLTVLVLDGKRKNRSFWRCRCDCGGEAVTTSYDLNSGRTRSCGCLVSLAVIQRNKASTTHGENNRTSAEYRAWCGMKRRCNNPKHPKYSIYGGRGIRVCDRWLHGDVGRSGFECFVADMGRRPPGKTSLDRFPNGDGNYEPENCRWADAVQQNNNRTFHREGVSP